MAETFICSNCGQEYRCSEMVAFEGQQLCIHCQGTLTEICEYCGERFWARDNCGDRHIAICRNCIDNYARCVRCGHLVPEDDLHYLNDDDVDGCCSSCWESHSPSQAIQSYYYKPEPIFYGDGTRYYGIELEIDEGGELDSKARKIMAVGNAGGKEHIYCKHDGSLSDGVEIVSHPATIFYHMNELPWNDILAEAVRLGYTSHQAGTAGLHIHVSKNALGSTPQQREDTIARILFFVEDHWDELVRFSRRSKRQLSQWADHFGRKDDPKATMDHVKKSSTGRYTCVNLENYATAEFRFIRGTLRPTSFYAALELVDRICEVCINLSDEEIKNLTWSEFVSGCTAPELVQYLKERRLYVNEPVAVSEEV